MAAGHARGREKSSYGRLEPGPGAGGVQLRRRRRRNPKRRVERIYFLRDFLKEFCFTPELVTHLKNNSKLKNQISIP